MPQQMHGEDFVLVPKVIEAVDGASLAIQIGLLRAANNIPNEPATYFMKPDGTFVAVIEVYQKVNNVLKGEIHG